jgi:acetyl esterase/lipase
MITRRTALTTALGVGGAAALAGCSDARGPSGSGSGSPSAEPQQHAYGTESDQVGELTLPPGERRPGVIVIIHGGFWRSPYTVDLGRPLAMDLASRGYAVWNLEYRRVGADGDWPNVLADVAAGFDHLRELPGDLDVDRAVVIGHSAGGQLAGWLAGRSALPTGTVGADPKITPVGVVAQAGVMDLVGAADDGVGGSAVADLLGGRPGEVADRYRIASPLAQIPLEVPVRCVHARGDGNVPYAQSETYVQAAKAAGADAELITAQGDHFTLIDPTDPDWQLVVDLLPALLA